MRTCSPNHAPCTAHPSLTRNSVSLFFLVGLFDLWDGLVTILISASGAYAIAYFFRSSPYMPWMGFAFTMGHMSVSHIWRQMAESTPSTIDITGTQMVLVMKVSAFCWNVADGQLPEEHLEGLQKDRMLKELPSLLDYAGYIFFFPSLLIGPAFDFAEYRRWLDTSMFDLPANFDPANKPPVRRKRKIPRSATPAVLKAVTGLTWIALYMFFGGRYDFHQLTSDSFLQYGLVRRIWIMYMVNLTARFKYYGSWSLTEGACILTGLGYKGVDPVTGKVMWNRLQNIDPWAVETAQNPRGYLAGWNINTNNWLRNYVYLRVTPRGKKPGFRASLLTFGTSALWHGFYPGYYLTFILASLIQTAAKCTRTLLITLRRCRLLTYTRFPPPRPALLPGPRVRQTNPEEEVLRFRDLCGHATHLLLRNNPFPRPKPERIHAGLGSRLLLRCPVDRGHPRVLQLARQGHSAQGVGEAHRCEEGQDDSVCQ